MPSSMPLDLKKAIDYAALEDRNVLITGGASGLGKAFVHMFAQHGANVVIADIQDNLGRSTEEELADNGRRVKFIHVDVASFESQVQLIRKALDFFPRHEIDIFVPSAGVLGAITQIDPRDPEELATLTACPAEMSSRMININLSAVLTGVMLVTRYGMGLHKQSATTVRHKNIVLVASMAGYFGAEGWVEYNASKFGVRGVLRGLRRQLARLGVRINGIAPWFVETPMIAELLRNLGDSMPVAPIEYVVEAVARLATSEDAWGRSVFVMPEGLYDARDDAAGGQGGKAFSVEGFGEQWDFLVNGSMSDTIDEEDT